MKIPGKRIIITVTILFAVIYLRAHADFHFKSKNPKHVPPEKITIAYSTAGKQFRK